jgi:hypothetical protein
MRLRDFEVLLKRANACKRGVAWFRKVHKKGESVEKTLDRQLGIAKKKYYISCSSTAAFYLIWANDAKPGTYIKTWDEFFERSTGATIIADIKTIAKSRWNDADEVRLRQELSA